MTHGEPAFGREHDALCDLGGSVSEPAADDLFRLTAGIHIRRIHQSATRLDEAVELLMRAGLVRLDPEGHGS